MKRLIGFTTEDYDKAKLTMREALLLLKAECEKDGTRLILTHATGCWTFMRNEADSFLTKSDFLLARYKWLAHFANANGIEYLDLQSYLMEYQRMHNLPSPAFDIPWDGHWTSLTHRVVANKTAAHLGTTCLREKTRRTALVDL